MSALMRTDVGMPPILIWVGDKDIRSSCHKAKNGVIEVKFATQTDTRLAA